MTGKMVRIAIMPMRQGNWVLTTEIISRVLMLFLRQGNRWRWGPIVTEIFVSFIWKMVVMCIFIVLWQLSIILSDDNSAFDLCCFGLFLLKKNKEKKKKKCFGLWMLNFSVFTKLFFTKFLSIGIFSPTWGHFEGSILSHGPCFSEWAHNHDSMP